MDNATEYRRYLLTGEHRGANQASGSAGGFTVPTEMASIWTDQLQGYAVLLSRFTRIPTDNARPLNAPVRSIATAGALVTEGNIPGDNDMTIGSRSMGGYLIASGVHKVSLQLETDSTAFPIESVIADFAGEAIGRRMSTYSVSGTGSSQPAGLIPSATQVVNLTAAQKVPTFSDPTAATTTELIGQVLHPNTILAMIAAVDPAYHPNAAWYFNLKMFTNLCKVVDSTGQPLIRPNGPRTLYGWPVIVANELPDLAASATGGPVFGDLAKAMYHRDAGFEVVRLDERFGDSLQIGYVGYHLGDLVSRDSRAYATIHAQAT